MIDKETIDHVANTFACGSKDYRPPYPHQNHGQYRLQCSHRDALKVAKQLIPFSITKKDKLDKANMIGVIAQDLEASGMNGLIDERYDHEGGKDLETTSKAVKYSVLYMKAIKALQEAMTRIETLEAEVAKLKG